MNRDRLKILASDERFIPGIYNYCDRWCERCPQTSRCLNFSVSEEEFSDPQTRDIRNKAFWSKLSEIFAESLEMLKEGAKKWGIEIETSVSAEDEENIKAKEEATKNHLLCRVAKRYSELVEGWFEGEETFSVEGAAAPGEGFRIEEAVEVIRWYQYFITAKVMRTVWGNIEEKDEGCDEFPSDADGSAKIALIAIDRSIAAWAVIQRGLIKEDKKVMDIIGFLDALRQAVEKTFPNARSFIRPGFDETERSNKAEIAVMPD